MTRERNIPARNIRINPAERSKKILPQFKDLIEKASGLMPLQTVSSICDFIKNPENDKQERAALINSLSNAMLVPDTDDRLQSTLSKLSKEDSSNLIKTASENVFTTLRDKHAFPYQKVV